MQFSTVTPFVSLVALALAANSSNSTDSGLISTTELTNATLSTRFFNTTAAPTGFRNTTFTSPTIELSTSAFYNTTGFNGTTAVASNNSRTTGLTSTEGSGSGSGSETATTKAGGAGGSGSGSGSESASGSSAAAGSSSKSNVAGKITIGAGALAAVAAYLL